MEATLNVMLLTFTTAVFCDNDMYVVDSDTLNGA